MAKIKKPNNLTPMFKQYFDLKEQYPDSLLLFRCGDFYELYGEDALIGAKAMEITLTSREMGKGRRIEMAGIPYHALNNYLPMLVSKGIKVAVCEQLEDPKKSKGLVKRDVTKVITSGTVIDSNMLEEDRNNYLMVIATEGKHTSIAVGDVSTGEMKITYIPKEDISRIKDEIFRLKPSEILIDQQLHNRPSIEEYVKKLEIPMVSCPMPSGDINQIKKAFRSEALQNVPWEKSPALIKACSYFLKYLSDTQKTHTHSIYSLEYYEIANFMILDATTWRNLELSHTIIERQKKGSLLWILDHTKTGMGARRLRSWLERPLLDIKEIERRHKAVEEFVTSYSLYQQVVNLLNSIYDLERISSKIIYGNANARDLLSLRNSLKPLPKLKEILSKTKSSLLQEISKNIDPLEDVYDLIYKSIAEDPPANLKEGNIIKDGYNLELDELRQIRKGAKEWIAQLEQREKERTGIKSLKVKFNNVFGYFIEITRPNLHLVPKEYIRKQTIANGERFISPELKEYEAKVLGAEEKIIELEYRLFLQVRQNILEHSYRIQKTSQAISQVDALSSLAYVAMEGRYVKPTMTEESVLEIKQGRHPVVEKFLKGDFVPNDTKIGYNGITFHIITGPNMSGKSTYLRQIGLIVIMAQMGSFVPAEYAKIGITDRVFTRVGASDDLHLGKSTFLVEMSETANIIKNATPRSLILLDEIGRGTSTFDGLSIAWAVSEYIHNRIGARTLFATHFHQLTRLEKELKGIKNFRVDVKETGKDIVFLHRIVEGGTDKSYGIYVAKLAGLPTSILRRAGEILEKLESEVEDTKQKGPAYQLTFFDLLQSPLIEEVKRINPDDLSPREALNKIYQWKKMVM